MGASTAFVVCIRKESYRYVRGREQYEPPAALSIYGRSGIGYNASNKDARGGVVAHHLGARAPPGAMGAGSRSRRRAEALASGSAPPASADEASEAGKRRAHKARQRRRKAERRDAAVEAILARLRVPPEDETGTFPRVEDAPAWVSAPPLDWAGVPPACDPARVAHDGEEEDVGARPPRGRPAAAAASSGPPPRDPSAPRDLPSSLVALRAERKRRQVETFAVCLRELLPGASSSRGGRRPRVVDFGAGSGALILPLAALFPEADFVAVEMKARSAALLERRAAAARLPNVTVRVAMIEAADMDFDVGVALHACGNATDHAMVRCVARRAAFVVSPCCIGKLKFSLEGGSSFSAVNTDWTKLQDERAKADENENENEKAKGGKRSPREEESEAGGGATPGPVVPCRPVVPETTTVSCVVTHPRSRWTASLLSSPEREFAALAAAADTGHGGDFHARSGELGRRAKVHVELDRAQWAREAGFEVVTLSVAAAETAPANKADVLVGRCARTGAPGRLDRLRARGGGEARRAGESEGGRGGRTRPVEA